MNPLTPLTPPQPWVPKSPGTGEPAALTAAALSAALTASFAATPAGAASMRPASKPGTSSGAGAEAAAHAWLEQTYAALAAKKGFRAREAQLQLAKAVATALLLKQPLAAEAPTGTGKTLAYLLGALAARKQQGAESTEPVVISTATKALQQQLLSNDLPALIEQGLLGPEQVSLAKGKGNYLCLMHAQQAHGLLQQAQSDPELFAFHDIQDLDEMQLGEMLQAFSAREWDGDFDHYEGLRTFPIRAIAVNGDTCLKRKCEHYHQCAYTRARTRLAESSLIVTNHDLLLMDLMLSSTGEGEGALPVASYRLVIDEAHHLPDKAISVGSSQLSLTHLLNTLPKLQGAQKTLQGTASFAHALASRSLSAEGLNREPLQQALRSLAAELATLPVDDNEGLLRFARGVMPAPVKEALSAVLPPMEAMLKHINQINGVLRESGGAGGAPLGSTEQLAQLIRKLMDVKAPLEEGLTCVRAFLGTSKVAKWLARKSSTLSLHAAPLEGRDVLKPFLWDNGRVRHVAMLSATLRDFASFARYRHRAGLPEGSRTLALPAQFDYARSELFVAPMRATPKMAERRAFLQELREKLPSLINPKEGTLVLFPSWAMLKELTPVLREHLYGKAALRVQSDVPIKQLLRGHCAAIDAGEGSVLAGVATLSEGLDLPGDYCRHVVIVALPFAAPTDPVEQELSDLLGSRYFSERSLPDAMIRLTQMVGRLIRREDDSGRVTVLDRRLAATSYGRQMMAALPGFKKTVAPLAGSSA